MYSFLKKWKHFVLNNSLGKVFFRYKKKGIKALIIMQKCYPCQLLISSFKFDHITIMHTTTIHFSIIKWFSLCFNLVMVLSCNSPSTNSTPSTLTPSESPNTALAITVCDSGTIVGAPQLNSFTYSDYNFVIGPGRVRLGGNSFIQEDRLSKQNNKGVQIAVNIDNATQVNSNQNIFNHPLENGRYNFFAFVITPFNESLKQTTAVLAKEIEVVNGNLAKSNPFPGVAVVYNSPRGSFSLNQKVLLDFVLVNTNLAPNGNSIKVTIDGQFVQTIHSWTAHYIEGLTKGEHRIQLELIDATKRQIAPVVSETITIE